MTVAVVTDSSAVLPPDADVHIVPLQVALPDGSTVAGDLPFEAIVDRLDGSAPPTTAAPSPGHYLELYETLLKQADALFVVCPPADLSVTYSNAVMAAREVEGVRVLDANTAAAGQGLVAAAAARVAGAGADLKGVEAYARLVAARVEVWATLSQLRFLRRSGRVPAIVAAAGGALNLQPIVRYAGGSPRPTGVVRSRGRAVDRLLSPWERASSPADAIVFHSARLDDAEVMAKRMTVARPDRDVTVRSVSASLGAHVGPGLLGLAWRNGPE